MDKTQALEKLFMEDEVRRGIALLNEKVEGWREGLDLDELDLNDVGRCVLGQHYGDYYTGKTKLHLSTTQSQEYGFSVPARLIEFSNPDEIEFAMLTHTWKVLLAA